MKINSTQQEILLFTGTSFSCRQCFQKDGGSNHLTEKQQLEEACWNGLLQYILPEIYEQESEKKLYLWKIKEAASFIEIDLGELPEEKENYFSIDPYSFLPICLLS